MATKNQFELYKKEVKRLIRKFHIDTWCILFTYGGIEEEWAAQLTTNVETRKAEFYISDRNIMTQAEVKECALHEVCHLLITEVSDAARERYMTSECVTQAIESTTQKLERLLGNI